MVTKRRERDYAGSRYRVRLDVYPNIHSYAIFFKNRRYLVRILSKVLDLSMTSPWPRQRGIDTHTWPVNCSISCFHKAYVRLRHCLHPSNTCLLVYLQRDDQWRHLETMLPGLCFEWLLPLHAAVHTHHIMFRKPRAATSMIFIPMATTVVVLYFYTCCDLN